MIVTREDGTTEDFTFEPWPESGDRLGLTTVWHPQFVPDPGVTSSLRVPDVLLSLYEGEYVSWGAAGASYNPADPVFGGIYTHLAQDGFRRTTDAKSGQLRKTTDRHGNELTFGDGGITSNRGRAVTFERDQVGRIEAKDASSFAGWIVLRAAAQGQLALDGALRVAVPVATAQRLKWWAERNPNPQRQQGSSTAHAPSEEADASAPRESNAGIKRGAAKAPVKTGGESGMKESHSEGVAHHAGPESCAGGSHVAGEALTRKNAGQVSSSEITSIGVPTRCGDGEGHTQCSVQL